MDSTELREKLKNGRYVIGKPPAMGCFLCRCGYDYYISLNLPPAFAISAELILKINC